MASYNPMNLCDRRVLVTGASSGIGRACAVCAARLGASLILTGRRLDALEETRTMLEGDGARHLVFRKIDFVRDFFAHFLLLPFICLRN